MEGIFKAFDKNADGKINYKEFLDTIIYMETVKKWTDDLWLAENDFIIK